MEYVCLIKAQPDYSTNGEDARVMCQFLKGDRNSSSEYASLLATVGSAREIFQIYDS
jgi:hypothetical protein